MKLLVPALLILGTVGGVMAACSDDSSSGGTGGLPDASTGGFDSGGPTNDTDAMTAADTSTPVDGAVDAGEDANGPTVKGCNAGKFVFNDDFSLGLRPQFWKVTYTPTNDAAASPFNYTDDAGALHFAKTGDNPGGLNNIGAELNLTAAGGPVLSDFSMQVDFKDAVVGATQIDQMELHAVFDDNTYFFDVYSNENGLEFHVWDGNFEGQVFTSANAGTMKITRVGTTLSGYTVSGGTDTLIFSKEQPTTPMLTLVDFVAQVYNTNNMISITFDNFHIDGSCALP